MPEPRATPGPVAIVADAHLGGPGGPAAPLVAQLAEIPGRGCRRLILLGDIFQLWIGDRRYETEDIRQVVEALVALRGAGVRIDYIEGNRDFFLANSPYAHAFDTVGDEVAFEAGGRRYLAVHGDGLDRRDVKYRFWRAISKGPSGRLFARLLPRPWARRMVHGTERKLSATNLEHKRRIPEEVLREYGRRRLAEGYDEIVMGHFHAPLTLEAEGGTVRLLAPWYDSRSIEWFG